jgi:DNA repair protein RecN (Recombination protein N)
MLHGRTVTRIRKLGADERVDEITRMLGGDSAVSRKHAQELLKKHSNGYQHFNKK